MWGAGLVLMLHYWRPFARLGFTHSAGRRSCQLHNSTRNLKLYISSLNHPTLPSPPLNNSPEGSEELHDLAAIAAHESLENRNGSLDLVLGDESEDANHREAAVLQLAEEPALHGLVGHLLAKASGVVKVDDIVADLVTELLEGRVQNECCSLVWCVCRTSGGPHIPHKRFRTT